MLESKVQGNNATRHMFKTDQNISAPSQRFYDVISIYLKIKLD